MSDVEVMDLYFAIKALEARFDALQIAGRRRTAALVKVRMVRLRNELAARIRVMIERNVRMPRLLTEVRAW